MELEQHKIRCEECGWIGTNETALSAPGPFNDDFIQGCPWCKSCCSMVCLCDEPGCLEDVSRIGHRSTCEKHAPQYMEDIK